MQQLSDEAVTLITEDIRDARIRLGVSMKVAAASASLEPCVYRAIEEGTHSADGMNLGIVRLVARRLGLKELRIAYVEENNSYIRWDISETGPLTLFVDTSHLDFEKLREEIVWTTPSQILTLTARYDFNKVSRSRRLADKQLMELWITSVFSLCCVPGRNYYVRLAESDPPDAEVLALGDAGEVNRIGIEITQHGVHSPGLTELIRKKLRFRLPTGTIIVIFVAQAEYVSLPDLKEVIDHNNPHNQQICIVGQSQEPHQFKFATYGGDKPSDPKENWWSVKDFDDRDASRGYRGYEGVMYMPKGPVARQQLLFVKNLALDR